MDSLPVELIFHIFRYISINDLINCRQVCKKFKNVCEEKKIDQLIIDEATNCETIQFQDSNKLTTINNNIIEFSKILPHKSTFKLDQNLIRLEIVYFEGSEFELNFLNSLLKLEELLIRSCEEGQYMISLPNLRIFDANIYDHDGYRFYLNTPKLQSINCFLLELIEIENPLAIKKLKCEDFDDQIIEFQNLEYLEYQNAIEYVDRDILMNFENLKELHLYCTSPDSNQRFSPDAYVIDSVSYIMKQKLVLRRMNFNLYLQGVLIKDKNVLNDFAYSSDLEFQIKNFDSLVGCVSRVENVNYTDLINLMGNNIPTTYFTKFCSIQKVKVTGKVNDGQHLIWFLKNLKCLNKLSLKYASLDQKFYNSLSEVYQLQYLKINECSGFKINYEFIQKMKSLLSFQTNQQFVNPINFIVRSLRRSKKLISVKFKCGKNDQILIGKSLSEQNRFSLMWYSSKKKHNSFEEFPFEVKFNGEKMNAHELATVYSFLINKSLRNTESVCTRSKLDTLYRLIIEKNSI